MKQKKMLIAAIGGAAFAADYLLGTDLAPWTVGGLMGAEFVIPTKYVMPAGAKDIVEIWRKGTDEQRVENMLKVKKMFNAKGTDWDAAPDMVTTITYWADRMDTLCKNAKGVRASTADRALRNQEMVQALYYFKHPVHQFCEDAVANPDNKMQLVDMNLMGFLFGGQNHGHHDRNPIPTKRPFLKFAQTVTDKLKVIFENSEGVNAKGKGPAWPDGVNGGVVRFKKTSESEADWRYEYCPKIHNTISMPAGWRGQEIHIQGAYYAHPNDPRELLHWSDTQTFFAHQDIVDDGVEAAKALADAKAEAVAKDAEIAALKAQLEARKKK